LVYWGPPTLSGWEGRPTGTDATAYINVAVQIAKGHGLSEDWSDPTLLKWFDIKLEPAGMQPWPSTRWPPLFPMAAGLVFRVGGFDLAPVFTLNCLFMALACGLIAGVMDRLYGLGVA